MDWLSNLTMDRRHLFHFVPCDGRAEPVRSMTKRRLTELSQIDAREKLKIVGRVAEKIFCGREKAATITQCRSDESKFEGTKRHN